MAHEPPITSPYAPDIAHVRAWLEKMIKAVRFVEIVAAIVSLVTRMRDLNTELTRQLSQLRRKRPRSETLDRIERQLVLPLTIVTTNVAKTDSGSTPPGAEKKPGRRGRHPGRAALPAHLERVRVVNAVTQDKRICPLCGSEMTTVGHSRCETLEVIPAKVIVVERLDERVACPNDDEIASALTPPAIVERGKLGDTLIVEALCDKYLEHQPIERQCVRFDRAGVEIAPQTLGRSVCAAIDLLSPVARLIEEQTRAPGLLATDATGLPVLDRDAPDGIRTGAMWCWTNARWVTFFYSASGDSDSVRRFLGDDLARTVQCDGTSTLSFIERAGGKRPGCWSHGRRGLAEAARLGDSIALEGLRMIAPLFAIERASTLAGDTAEQRRTRRAEQSQCVLDKLRAWLDAQRAAIPPKTPLGKALGYLDRQWHRLVLFLEDGNIELTNNRRERELRRLVLGRKNWLFTWEDLGGERTGAILTIIGTCIAHDINPRAYLHAVTKLIVHRWPHARLRELLPDRMLASHPDLGAGDRPALPTSAEVASLGVT
jgi:transposase